MNLIALLACIAVANDASNRGMNAWGWSIGIFLLLIVFLTIYFITRKPLLKDQLLEVPSETLDDLDRS